MNLLRITLNMQKKKCCADHFNLMFCRKVFHICVTQK